MVILDVDHPDVEEFIWCKAIEERKARVLRDAGFDMDLDGRDSHSIQYQNANNSVRVTDEFMQAVLDDADWHLTGRHHRRGRRARVPARDLMRQISEADVGVRRSRHAVRHHDQPVAHRANTGRINGSNPCSEYMHLDNSACNLASHQPAEVPRRDAAEFDVEGFQSAVEVVFTAQEILVGNADYPTEAIGETTRRFRQLGLGYANLGALLMALGLPYDSDGGRAWAGAITALHDRARVRHVGPHRRPHGSVRRLRRERRAHAPRAAHAPRRRRPRSTRSSCPTELLSAAAAGVGRRGASSATTYGVRNSQATVLAPTGCLVGGTLVPTERASSGSARSATRRCASGRPSASTCSPTTACARPRSST